MNNDNDITLQSYDDHIDEYVASLADSINADTKAWIDQALTLIPTNGSILEIGSGSGREADYIETKGYKVGRTDASQGFVDFMTNNGHQARLLNALTDDFGNGHDMVLAIAVLLHFTPEETDQVLARALASLKSGGIFASSVKQGKGGEWLTEKIDAPRYFQLWEEADLRVAVNQAGFEIVDVMHGVSRTATWLQVTAKK